MKHWGKHFALAIALIGVGILQCLTDPSSCLHLSGPVLNMLMVVIGVLKLILVILEGASPSDSDSAIHFAP